jgi:hypothetical protein
MSFYRVPEHCSCRDMFQQMQAFCDKAALLRDMMETDTVQYITVVLCSSQDYYHKYYIVNYSKMKVHYIQTD